MLFAWCHALTQWAWHTREAPAQPEAS
jgi:hypothetical protein